MVLEVMHNVKVVAIFLCILIFLSSCDSVEIFNQDDDLSDFIASVKAKPKLKIEPDPMIPEYIPYRYTVNNLRDPFQLPITKVIRITDPNCKQPVLSKGITFIQKYDLSSFRYVGPFLRVLEKLNDDKDKVEAVYGLVKIEGRDEVIKIRKGDIVGTNYGEVKAIHSNVIELEEKISNGMGGWICRSASIVKER